MAEAKIREFRCIELIVRPEFESETQRNHRIAISESMKQTRALDCVRYFNCVRVRVQHPLNKRFTQYLLVSVIAIETAKSNTKNSQYDTKHDSKVPSIRFQNVKPLHSGVDVSASCPRCLAAAAQKPNGGDGECISTVWFHYSSSGSPARSLARSSSFSLTISLRCTLLSIQVTHSSTFAICL